MGSWVLNGSEEIGPFLNLLERPREISEDFASYVECLGDDFTIDQLFKLYEIRAKALMAKAVYDLPEFTMDQLFRAFNSGQVIRVEVEAHIDQD